MSGTTSTNFFWTDWMSDPGVRRSSFAARGLWMDMLCIAAQHDPTGYLAVNRKAIDLVTLARMVGGDQSEVRLLIEELERNGVFSRDRNGTIYSRRMVKDAKRRQEAKKNGKLGGNPNLTKQTIKSRTLNPPLKPPDKLGWNGKDEIEDLSLESHQSGTPPPREIAIGSDDLLRRLGEAAGGNVDWTSPATHIVAPIIALISAGCDLEKHILPTIRAKAPALRQPLRTWGAKWLLDEISAAAKASAASARVNPDRGPVVDFGGGYVWPEASVTKAISMFRKDPTAWPPMIGPPPGAPGCKVPKHLLEGRAA